ncbi:MAG: hypothetical protein DI564_09640 [Rhodanobacter denitrificans]|uniref:Uncharacterized protein n=1 Tax=Rhodanobacter denitrificans TaxID=666685 RepID=A0A2W5KCA8_9GAMM|nr:MAG: hypothetical protein DI564_09640 [Rhodanobacter denitrificans]
MCTAAGHRRDCEAGQRSGQHRQLRAGQAPGIGSHGLRRCDRQRAEPTARPLGEPAPAQPQRAQAGQQRDEAEAALRMREGRFDQIACAGDRCEQGRGAEREPETGRGGDHGRPPPAAAPAAAILESAGQQGGVGGRHGRLWTTDRRADSRMAGALVPSGEYSRARRTARTRR